MCFVLLGCFEVGREILGKRLMGHVKLANSGLFRPTLDFPHHALAHLEGLVD